MQPDGPLPDDVERARLAASHLAGTNPITGQALDPDPQVELSALAPSPALDEAEPGSAVLPEPTVTPLTAFAEAPGEGAGRRAGMGAAGGRDGAPSGPVGRTVRGAATGALAGVVGTLSMSLLMLPAQWAGLLGTQPPRRVSDRLVVQPRSGDATEDQRRAGTTVMHLAIGATGGAILGGLRGLTDRRGPALLAGSLFGAVLWAVNYILIAPALRFFPPPWRDRPGRPPVMFAANVLFGAVAGQVGDALAGRGRRRQ